MEPLCLARLGLLGNPLRVTVLRLLIRHLPHPLAAGDLARALAVPPSTLSAHLAALCDAGLLVQRAQGPLRLYHAVPGALAHVIDWLGADVALGRAGAVPEREVPGRRRSARARLLFLCSDGALLSPLAAALARRRLRGGARVSAAGADPACAFDPLLLALLGVWGLPPPGDVPRGAMERGADMVIALDTVAADALPLGSQMPPPVCAYWPLPRAGAGRVIPRAVALHAAMCALEPRLAALARLPSGSAPREAVQAALDSLSSGLPEVARAAGSAPAPRRRSPFPALPASAAS
ncbi:ArsR/SmtB family transcription factor [Salipiger mangrovisoli]|uniref:Winged helix-turn-helix transcriptional regulator n=1 Tax=Salipiger mangrovisoli TaxID=2865933 RepID=A0ABR9X4D2_9RHOB|nr:helix-turn-helix domain-containing protein [Salipiger mangrovisoli]MBE9638372.1 winged helix-turn-helix transcriptional regulator [Salipiger mangrovisoli]